MTLVLLIFAGGIFAEENVLSVTEQPPQVDQDFFVDTNTDKLETKEIIEVERSPIESKYIEEETNEQEIILEEKVKEEQVIQDLLQKTIQEKIVLKYKIHIDTIIERLYDKIAHLTKQQQEQVLIEMQQKVLGKKPIILKSEDILPLRKQVLIEIIDYIATSLDPNFLSIVQEGISDS